MHFDPTISLGNLITFATFIIAAVYAWRDLTWRVSNLETWRDTHEHATVKALENIDYLRRIVAKMEEMIRGQNRRLEILEEHPHARRQQ